jgi:transaldolase
MQNHSKQSIEEKIQSFLRSGFSPRYGQMHSQFKTNAHWKKCNDVGTELWLDTGNVEDISRYWTQEFRAVTTNNTLLNKEVQTGRYDRLITDIDAMFEEYNLDRDRKKLEFAFVLNAYHALRLVEKFDAYVSVEEHTDLAYDVGAALSYARRYYSICPERFIVKMPFTPAGLLATRLASREGIPVNHTLGFSARQNYLIARISRPAFVNVFLGRLNSFVQKNGLGSGEYIGEKATLASNEAVKELRRSGSAPSRQIAASLREGQQVESLLGVDVMTMPPAVADGFIKMDVPVEKIASRTGADYEPGVSSRGDIEKYGIDMFWEVPDGLIHCADKLEREDLDAYTPDKLIDFFHANGCGDMLVRWNKKQIQTSMNEGKIPHLDHWKDAILGKSIGMDSLMNLAGLCSFTVDQKAMDDRVTSVLEKAGRA